MKLQIKILILFFIMWLQAMSAFAATIVLQDGHKIEVEKYWEEGALLKYEKNGITVGLPLERVKRIEDSPALRDDKVMNFGFDYWKIGTMIEDVVEIAERNDIPLLREGFITSNNHFSAKLCRPYIQTHSKFKYQQTILGYPAKVLLTFTPESRRLAHIVVRFNANQNKPGRKPNDDVLEMLGQKYGKPQSIAVPLFKRSVLEWTIQGGNIIRLVSSISAVDVTYKNNLWSDRLEKERQYQIDLKRKDDFQKDAGKF